MDKHMLAIQGTGFRATGLTIPMEIRRRPSGFRSVLRNRGNKAGEEGEGEEAAAG